MALFPYNLTISTIYNYSIIRYWNPGLSLSTGSQNIQT